MAVKDTASTFRHDQAERLHSSADRVRQLDDRLKKLTACRHQRSGQHAVEAFHPNNTVKTDFSQMRETISVVGIGLVGCHVERSLGVPSVDADCRQSFSAQRVVEPYRQWAGFKHHALDIRCMFADQRRQRLRIRCAFAAPNPLAVAADRNGCVLQRHIETNKIARNVLPSRPGPTTIASQFRILTGKQPKHPQQSQRR